MEKKAILEILHDLKPYWELADWMIALIEAWFMDKETYQNTLFMIATAIKKMPKWEEKSNLELKFSKLKSTKENDKKTS